MGGLEESFVLLLSLWVQPLYPSEFPGTGSLLGGVGRKKLRPSLFSAVLGKGPSLKNEVMNNPLELCDEATEKNL